MNANEMRRRTKRFALDTIAAVDALPRNRTADVIGRQLVRSATSVGANYRAVCRARSSSEFAAKLGIVEEEADESLYWLELLAEASLLPADAGASLSSECEEILRIIVASIKTARKGQSNGRRTPVGKPTAIASQSEIRNPKWRNAMLIVGERINTSRKVKGELVIEQAVVNRDAEFIAKMAKDQTNAGATYIDVNCGTLTAGEPEALEWITKVVQEAVDVPICFDTPNPAAMERAIAVYDTSKGQPMVNSITAETDRWKNILPFVQKYKTKVIALAMDDTGIQEDASKRLSVARDLVKRLMDAGVPVDDIYVDPLTFPIANGSDFGVTMLDIIEKIMTEFPGVHTIAGISNISHGLPGRKFLNEAMTVLSMCKGLDAAIIDPQDRYLMALIASTEAILGRDDFSMNYITLFREGRFEGL